MKQQFCALSIIMYIIIIFNNQVHSQNLNTKKILWTTDWSPNGKYIAVAGNTDTLVIYRSKSMIVLKKIPFRSTVTRVKWHPSKNIIAITSQFSEDKHAIINLDTDTRTELTGISNDGARAMDWHETGNYIIIGDNDGQIFIFDVNGNLKTTFQNENTKSIIGVDWHPTKDVIVTVGEKIRLFDSKGNLLKSIKHRYEDVLLLSVAWHPRGDFFVTGDYGDEINKPWLQFWDEQGHLLKTIDIGKGEYRNIAWNQKGNRLASASDALRIWDKTGNLIHEGNSPALLWGLSWSPNAKEIVTSSIQQHVNIWDVKAKMLLDL
jgi:WD40 repeat protein